MKNGQQCQNTIGLKNMLCISDFSHWYETKQITRSNMWGRKDLYLLIFQGNYVMEKA